MRTSDLQLVYQQQLNRITVRSLEFSPDGSLLALGGFESLPTSPPSSRAVVRLLRAADGQLVRNISTSLSVVNRLGFFPDGQSLILLGAQPSPPHAPRQGSQVEVWRIDGELVRSQSLPVAWGVFSADRRQLAAVAYDEAGRAFLSRVNLDNGDIFRFAPLRRVATIAFSPDGASLLAHRDYYFELIRLADGSRRLFDVGTLYCFSQSQVAFSPDGERFAVSCFPNVLEWSIGTQQSRRLAPEGLHGAAFFGVGYSPDGQRIIGVTYEFVQFWDATTGAPISLIPFNDWIRGFSAFSPDGRYLAVGATGIRILNLNTGEVVRDIPASPHSGPFAFSPDGELIAAVTGNRDIQIWRVADGTLVHTLTGHQNRPNSLAFSPDGRILLSADDGRRSTVSPDSLPNLRFWDVATGQLLLSYRDSQLGLLNAVQFSPSGQFFAYSTDDGTVAVARNPFAPPQIQGDMNRDGCVNDADLLMVLFNFGATGFHMADGNGDGVVDDTDLLMVLFNFGHGC
ncbi:MAG: hypothetical protein NZ843_04740 [Fimbriimonadales bacterium]|nr:hypothetical protein [Fimbriimonadales bacterium]